MQPRNESIGFLLPDRPCFHVSSSSVPPSASVSATASISSSSSSSSYCKPKNSFLPITVCRDMTQFNGHDEVYPNSETRIIGDSIVRGQLSEFCGRSSKTRMTSPLPWTWSRTKLRQTLSMSYTRAQTTSRHRDVTTSLGNTVESFASTKTSHNTVRHPPTNQPHPQLLQQGLHRQHQVGTVLHRRRRDLHRHLGSLRR